METIIKLKPEELTHALVDKIKSYLSSENNFEITISLKEKPAGPYASEETKVEYNTRLDTSINEMQEGKVISFSMEELEEYISHNFSS